MTWLVWRQHRAQLCATALLLALVALIVLPSGLAMRESISAPTMSGCASNGSAPGCADLIAGFFSQFESTQNLVAFLNLVPALVGAFFGAPLLAREFEQGTWRLVWTQSVSRGRWLAVKLVLVGAGVAVAAGVFTAILTWWRGPLDRLESRFEPTAFNFEGLAPVTVWIFSFAVGVLAGILVRRTVPAMGTTVVAFLAVRLPVEFLLRPHYRPPVTRSTDLAAAGTPPSGIGGHDWVMSSTTSVVTYQPAERFWEFQLVEAGVYLSLTAVLIVVAVRLVTRRPW